MRALLISTFDLGRQPFGLASPAAWLRREGIDVRSLDLAKEKLDPEVLRSADLVAFHLPMHTATRLAAPVIKNARAMNPSARICAYGLYAPLNAAFLRSLGVDDVLGGEFEADLTAIARDVACSTAAGPPVDVKVRATPATLPRLQFLVPDRTGLPALANYATLQCGDGTRRMVGYTEASRGCRHLCRHCPVVPIYNGQFRVVQADVVLADVAAQVAAGAEHITFGDPDFFNGPTHALRIVEALHAAHPAVTYDVTIKVQHLLQHRELMSRLRETGCLFVTSAVESLDDRVLALLEKGHTRRDFFEAAALCRDAGLTIVPTFVAFHPWLSLEGYCDLLDVLADLDLVGHVAPIQLAIRLLIPEGSRLLELEEVRRLVGAFDARTLTYRWSHPDPRVDRLHEEVASLVGARLTSDRPALFDEICALAYQRAGLGPPAPRPFRDRAMVPYLSEPWYCCAEPNPEQVALV
ncbi:MAG TPA: CUAEP/CCAEP-tail radical SAM protein [Vicinamibacterales bacterium]|nr:CUAEP/CCAEP-tail radical SAM protein [Vicinamibacterales bacterium]